MAIFIGIHRIEEAVEDSVLEESWGKYKEIAAKRGLKPLRVTYNGAEKIAICETEANSREEVADAHAELGMQPAEIIEVKTSE